MVGNRSENHFFVGSERRFNALKLYSYTSFAASKTDFLEKLLQWTSSFPYVAFFNPSTSPYPLGTFEQLLAVGSTNAKRCTLWENHGVFMEEAHWKMGIWGYDLKNNLENVSSKNQASFLVPDIAFFEPEMIFQFGLDSFSISNSRGEPMDSLIFSEEIKNQTIPTPLQTELQLQPSLSKAEYVSLVQKIQYHIKRGDFYEMNFCMEFTAEGTISSPESLYFQMATQHPMPFGSFFKWEHTYILCASPERFIQKKGNQMFSQPIKGTRKRGTTAEIDEKLKMELESSIKERAENVMIVDLVRNDFSKICQPGSVKVNELCGMYSFPSVHQMISTIEGIIERGTSLTQIIEATFPMGSMTGAPKVSAMQWIDKFESFRRQMFSGSLAYITPEGDFDSNVIIRSLLYDAKTNKISCPVGSAITYYADAVQEYEECFTKAKNWIDLLGS